MAVIKVRQSDGTFKTVKAIRGKSAYELAVINGYTGSEKEWLESLKGTDANTSEYNTLETNDKTLVGSINELKDVIDNIDISDITFKITDAANDFTADSNGKKYLSNVLHQLFQFADNGKKSIAQTIGSPLSADDSFSDMNTKIQELLDSIKEALESNGITLDGDETLENLANKIDSDVSKRIFPKWYIIGDLWITAETMTTTRGSLTSSAVDNNIYVIGGDGGDDTTENTNECYDASTNTWTSKADMTTGRHYLTSSVVDNKIYVIGGYNNTSLKSNNECYDPSTDTWATKTDIRTARYGLTSSVIDNKIYCIGGNNAGSLKTNECYDPSANAWTTKGNMITGRYYLTSSAVDNKIYVIGGRNTNGVALKTNECYDPSTDAFTTKADMTTGRYELTSSVVDNKIYVIGGTNSGSLKTNECYDPSTDTWTTKADMITARDFLTSSAVDNKIYVIGGSNSYGILNTNECYIPSQD